MAREAEIADMAGKLRDLFDREIEKVMDGNRPPPPGARLRGLDLCYSAVLDQLAVAPEDLDCALRRLLRARSGRGEPRYLHSYVLTQATDTLTVELAGG
jgi:hypothetical protein